MQYKLIDDLRADKNKLFSYFRMYKVSFDELLDYIKSEKQKGTWSRGHEFHLREIGNHVENS